MSKRDNSRPIEYYRERLATMTAWPKPAPQDAREQAHAARKEARKGRRQREKATLRSRPEAAKGQAAPAVSGRDLGQRRRFRDVVASAPDEFPWRF